MALLSCCGRCATLSTAAGSRGRAEGTRLPAGMIPRRNHQDGEPPPLHAFRHIATPRTGEASGGRSPARLSPNFTCRIRNPRRVTVQATSARQPCCPPCPQPLTRSPAGLGAIQRRIVAHESDGQAAAPRACVWQGGESFHEPTRNACRRVHPDGVRQESRPGQGYGRPGQGYGRPGQGYGRPGQMAARAPETGGGRAETEGKRHGIEKESAEGTGRVRLHAGPGRAWDSGRSGRRGDVGRDEPGRPGAIGGRGR